jgi:predicted ABC-type ATPase
MSTFTVIAGPNGSGKSTMTRNLGLELGTTLLDPDAIARSLNSLHPEKAALQAGRIVLERLRERLETGQSTTIETTLSANQNLQWMRDASSKGFRVELFYVALESPLLNQNRVADRIRKGGHAVPVEDIWRRYERSMASLPKAIEIADFSTVFDNSGEDLTKVLECVRGKAVWRSSFIPTWVRQALNLMLEGS